MRLKRFRLRIKGDFYRQPNTIVYDMNYFEELKGKITHTRQGPSARNRKPSKLTLLDGPLAPTRDALLQYLLLSYLPSPTSAREPHSSEVLQPNFRKTTPPVVPITPTPSLL